LLRGINVGGKNIIKMNVLKRGFEEMGFSDVLTYIQSGNVIFRSEEKDVDLLIKKIENGLSDRFRYDSRVVILSHPRLKKVVTEVPEGFGHDPGLYRYDVIFLKNATTPAEVMHQITVRDGVDQAYPGDGVLYFSRLISRASQSRLSKIMSLPVYQYMTIRNWNTTKTLLDLMDKQPQLS